MRLYIAEKASVGRALAGVLPGDKTKGDNFIGCGVDSIVTWASGHLLELFAPNEYDERLSSWNLADLPIIPTHWKLKEIARTKGLLETIRGLLKKASEVVHAGDSDREGQLLIDEILEFCEWKGATKRLRINDVNPDAIRKAIAAIKDNAEFIGEYHAGQARSYADWLVGMNLSRFCTLSANRAGYNVLFSVGRVQTPTLGLVVKRDREIENFTPKQYFNVSAVLALPMGNRQIIGRWQPSADNNVLDEEGRLVSPEICKELEAKLQDADGTISKVDKKTHKKSPPLPYNLAKLQINAAKKLDITDTLEHAQKLYENGYITYPRSGCQYIPEGHHAGAEKVVDSVKIASHAAQDVIRNVDVTRKSPAWDDSKITEHHAIIPTSKVPLQGALSEMEQKIYDLICVRYLLQFLPEYEYEQTTVEFESAGETFKTSGRHVLNLGWMGWDKEEDDTKEDKDSLTFPVVAVGEVGKVTPSVEEKTTTPPKRFSYDTLLAAMNGIYAFVEDKEIRKLLKEMDGIGTPATQENIIKLLFDRNFIEKQKKQIISTSTGRGLIDILCSGGEAAVKLTKPDMTAVWELCMSKIERGEYKLNDFLSEMSEVITMIVSAPPLTVGEIPGIEKLKKCLNPECDGYLAHIKTDKSSFFLCHTCKTTFNERNGEPVAKLKIEGEVIEVDCPLSCGQKARQFTGQYGKYWRCRCSPDKPFKDVDGKPVVREERPKAKCPVRGCKGTAEQIPKKDGGKFWKCQTCGNNFSDSEGKPILAVKKEGKK